MEQKNLIYHVVTQNDFKTRTVSGFYKPALFDNDGFIHCTKKKSTTLLVLKDYFMEISETNKILVLEIDISKLKSEVKFEAPSPIGSGITHIQNNILFPHIYGTLNIDAINGIYIAEKINDNFILNEKFENKELYL